MEKVDFRNYDGTDVVFRKKDEDEDELSMKLPQRFYFEVDVIQDGNIAIEIKSDSDVCLYDGLLGEILHTGNKTVTQGKPFQNGDIIGCNMWMFAMKRVYMKGVYASVLYSTCTFSINGEDICKRPFAVEGTKISPMVYCDPKESEVKINLGELAFKHDPSNN